jgi:hypothetical protein
LEDVYARDRVARKPKHRLAVAYRKYCRLARPDGDAVDKNAWLPQAADSVGSQVAIADRTTSRQHHDIRFGESSACGRIEGHLAILQTVASAFPVARSYHDHVPSFAEAWGFVVGVKPDAAGRTVDPAALTASEVDALIATRGLTGLRYYDGETHAMSFALPRHVRERLAAEKRIIEDNHPLFAFR